MTDSVILLERTWPAEEQMVRDAVQAIDGARIVKLEPGSGLVEIDGASRGSMTRTRRELEDALPGWKIYEQSRYNLP